jgi:integrase
MQIWCETLANRAESTRKDYLAHFRRFVEWSGKTPDELREMKFQENQASKPWERNRVENLLRQYLRSMDGNYTCSTQKLRYAAVRSFFEAQGMPLFLKREDRPSGCAFGSKVLDREEIRRLKNATEYLRDKTLVLFLKDSGLRESDVAELLWRDLKDYGEGFMGFEIQTKKKKTKARGFVGPETTEVLNLYKEKRLQGTQKLPPEENIEDHPVFALLTNPSKRLRPVSMSGVIGDIIKLAGIERATPHGLRKFWEQNIHVENLAYQKQMNGRALTEVERAYFWKNTPELFEMYRANYHNLMIERQEFREAEERLRREYERETKTLKERIYELDQKNLELTQRLNGFTLSSDQVQELLRRIEKLEKQAKG